nr:TPA_asm: NADH dehydrogenase subunit 2 [Pseudomyrmex particeps]
MNLFSSLVVVPTMILTTLAPIMMSNLLPIWFIMEISNFMFIVYMMIHMKQKKLIFLYFLIQVVASFILLCSLIINPMTFILEIQMMIFTSLFMKTGIPPLHLWMPMISKFMPWMTLFFMLTIQKIIPLIMFNLLNMNKSVFMFILVMTMMVPPLTMINMKSMKMMITYSSINQTGWMVALIFINHQFWFLYLMIYTSIMLMISSIMKFTEISFKFFMYSFKKFNFMFTIMMMNLSSMPPFSFFMFKWFSTFAILISSNLKMMIIMLLINSLLLTFIYIKMMLWSLFINKFESKMLFNKMMKPKLKNILWALMLLLFPLIMLI